MSGDPLSVPELPDEPVRSTCALCGTSHAPDAQRCAECGFHLVAAQPNPFASSSLWILAGILVAVYAISLLLVAAAR